QPVVHIVSLPGEKMVEDGVQLLLPCWIARLQGPSSSEKLLIFVLRPIRVIGEKCQHLSLHADCLKGRRRGVEDGVPAVLEQKTTIWCKYLYSLSLHPYESPMRRAPRALSSSRVALVFQAARSDRRPWRFRA